MEVINLTVDEPTGRLYSWLPHDLEAEKVVFLPDACPGRAPLPTGTAVLTRQADWRRFAVSDCGCGMRLLGSSLREADLSSDVWEAVADRLRANKGGLGDLGGGNHFLDALVPVEGDTLHFLIHTGSRSESGHVDDLVDRAHAFDAEFDRVVSWAAENRAAVQATLEEVFEPLELLMDQPHNTYERLDSGGAIIRKGSIRVEPGDLALIPAHLGEEVALVRAGDRVEEILCSISHGTGRSMARGQSRREAVQYDFGALRERMLIPDSIADASLRTEGPYAYRDLEPCLARLSPYTEVVKRFRIVAYMGHL